MMMNIFRKCDKSSPGCGT